MLTKPRPRTALAHAMVPVYAQPVYTNWNDSLRVVPQSGPKTLTQGGSRKDPGLLPLPLKSEARGSARPSGTHLTETTPAWGLEEPGSGCAPTPAV